MRIWETEQRSAETVPMIAAVIHHAGHVRFGCSFPLDLQKCANLRSQQAENEYLKVLQGAPSKLRSWKSAMLSHAG